VINVKKKINQIFLIMQYIYAMNVKRIYALYVNQYIIRLIHLLIMIIKIINVINIMKYMLNIVKIEIKIYVYHVVLNMKIIKQYYIKKN